MAAEDRFHCTVNCICLEDINVLETNLLILLDFYISLKNLALATFFKEIKTQYSRIIISAVHGSNIRHF